MNKNKADRLVAKIISMRPDMEKLTDAELAAKTDEFKGRLSKGESLMSLLPEAYAVVREASRRTTGLEQFPVQILSGIYLNAGYIAEQATGEGKTLAAAMPSYLNALSGEGVHVVTVNDYLANRDAEDIGRIHRFLGLTVGCIVNASSTEKRREAYDCDITYVTNTELGFDYLRDNMTRRMEDRVQRGFHYCIIDEVDSVLIDEARTPLIISGGSGKPTQIYVAADALAKSMERGEASGEIDKISSLLGQEITETGDFIVDEKDQIITLTAQGVEKAEKYFGIENISDAKNNELYHNIILALRANYLMRKDKDYIVKDGEVLIVDEFTGRVMPGRRYSDGLHQAIEAKEGVQIKQENYTFATITYQNLFNKYDNAICVSIHQNQFTQPQYNGAQMFYSAANDESESLARSIQGSFVKFLQPNNQREIKQCGKELFLCYYSKNPTVMVECGFLSNPEEAARLNTEDYQGKVAFTIFSGITDFINRKSK